MSFTTEDKAFIITVKMIKDMIQVYFENKIIIPLH
jgi:hypothetical protein